MAMRVAVVIPCYNEAQRLDAAAVIHFATHDPCADLLFVDDGSTDATWERVRLLVEAAPARIDALRQPRNQGKAEAVRNGMQVLMDRGYDLVGFWDADLATPLGVLPHFIDLLEQRDDIDWVIGSRVRLLGRRIERRALRHYLGRAFATLASLTLAVPVYDTQCGAKLFRATRGLRRILATPFTSRWIFDVEMIRRLSLLDGDDRRIPAEVIFELPLAEWKDVRGSKVRAADFSRAVIELARIRFGGRSVPAAPDTLGMGHKAAPS